MTLTRANVVVRSFVALVVQDAWAMWAFPQQVGHKYPHRIWKCERRASRIRQKTREMIDKGIYQNDMWGNSHWRMLQPLYLHKERSTWKASRQKYEWWWHHFFCKLPKVYRHVHLVPNVSQQLLSFIFSVPTFKNYLVRDAGEKSCEGLGVPVVRHYFKVIASDRGSDGSIWATLVQLVSVVAVSYFGCFYQQINKMFKLGVQRGRRYGSIDLAFDVALFCTLFPKVTSRTCSSSLVLASSKISSIEMELGVSILWVSRNVMVKQVVHMISEF